MSGISPVASAANMAPTGSAPGGELGKDEFLRLFVTQLRNQDPLNPMESQEFVAQLAQFSTVEQLIEIRELLEIQAGAKASE